MEGKGSGVDAFVCVCVDGCVRACVHVYVCVYQSVTCMSATVK